MVPDVPVDAAEGRQRHCELYVGFLCGLRGTGPCCGPLEALSYSCTAAQVHVLPEWGQTEQASDKLASATKQEHVIRGKDIASG